MVNVLGVAFERRPGEGSSAAHQAFAVLEREGWAPEHATLRLVVAPCRWWSAADLVADAARDADAVVLFGARKARRRALVACFGRNEAKAAPDAAGYAWPGKTLYPGAAPVLGSSLSPHRLARALEVAGLPAKPCVVTDGYVYNQCFYRVLSDESAPPAALVRLPLSVESARAEGRNAHVNRMQIVVGVAAALCFAAAAADARSRVSCQAGADSLPAVHGNP